MTAWNLPGASSRRWAPCTCWSSTRVCSATLETSPKRSPPEPDDLLPEVAECRVVGRHCVIAEETSDDLRQPTPLFGDGLVHPPSQLLLDLPEFCPQAVRAGLPLEQECTPTADATEEGEPQKVEGFRFAEAALSAPGRRMATELDQAGFVRMERQCELREPLAHGIEKATCVALVLEADHQVIGVAHDDHVAGGIAPSPAFRPQVEDVMQVDIGKQWRCH